MTHVTEEALEYLSFTWVVNKIPPNKKEKSPEMKKYILGLFTCYCISTAMAVKSLLFILFFL